MKLFLICGILFSAQAFAVTSYDLKHRIVSTTDVRSDTGVLKASELMKSLKFDPQTFYMSSDWDSRLATCKGQGYYYINLIATIEFEGKETAANLSVMTMTQADLHRIYDAIIQNVNDKGLPQCILDDVYGESPTAITALPLQTVIFQPVAKPLCVENGIQVSYPITSCVNVQNLYP